MLHSFCRVMKKRTTTWKRDFRNCSSYKFLHLNRSSISGVFYTMKNEFSIATINWFFWNLSSIHLASYTPILSRITATSYDKNTERITNKCPNNSPAYLMFELGNHTKFSHNHLQDCGCPTYHVHSKLVGLPIIMDTLMKRQSAGHTIFHQVRE